MARKDGLWYAKSLMGKQASVNQKKQENSIPWLG
jgi:hypothetical protein